MSTRLTPRSLRWLKLHRKQREYRKEHSITKHEFVRYLRYLYPAFNSGNDIILFADCVITLIEGLDILIPVTDLDTNFFRALSRFDFKRPPKIPPELSSSQLEIFIDKLSEPSFYKGKTWEILHDFIVSYKSENVLRIHLFVIVEKGKRDAMSSDRYRLQRHFEAMLRKELPDYEIECHKLTFL